MQSGQCPRWKECLRELQTIPAAPSSPLADKPSRVDEGAARNNELAECADDWLVLFASRSTNAEDIGWISTIRVAFARQASCRGRVT